MRPLPVVARFPHDAVGRVSPSAKNAAQSEINRPGAFQYGYIHRRSIQSKDETLSPFSPNLVSPAFSFLCKRCTERPAIHGPAMGVARFAIRLGGRLIADVIDGY